MPAAYAITRHGRFYAGFFVKKSAGFRLWANDERSPLVIHYTEKAHAERVRRAILAKGHHCPTSLTVTRLRPA